MKCSLCCATGLGPTYIVLEFHPQTLRVKGTWTLARRVLLPCALTHALAHFMQAAVALIVVTLYLAYQRFVLPFVERIDQVC